MRLVFEKVVIHNFMSFKDQEFDLSKQSGLTLVCGKNLDVKNSKNGVGKSSLFSAILYSLFGELQYVIKNENLRNKYVDDKEMWVELFFSANSKRYSVKRSLKGKQTSIEFNEINSYGDIVLNLNRSSISETDAYIQREIINCDISVFLRTIFLSSEQNYNFFKLTPSAKRDFIEKIFNISIFGEMYTLIHRDLLKTDKDIVARQNKLIILNKNEEQYSDLREKFDSDTREKVETIKSDIENLVIRESELLNNSVSDVDTEKLSTIESTIEKYNLERDTNTTKINKLADNLRELLSSKASDVATLGSKEKILQNHNTILDNLCDDCAPIFKKYYNIDNISADILKLKQSIGSLENKITRLSNAYKKLIDRNKDIDLKISDENHRLHSLIDDSNKYKQDLLKIRQLIDDKNIALNNIENMSNPYSELYESNHALILEENAALEEISNKYNYLKFIENIVSTDTLKKFIIKDLVGLLNSKIKHYLAKLGGNFECVFDENMNCEFKTAGGTYDYQNFSSGEQMRLMIASCFAFKDFMQTRNNFHSNILVLDEFIDSGIDSLAITGVIKILREFVKTNKQTVYVISHRGGDLDNSMFNSIIQIEKKNNISIAKYSDKK